jgi:N-acylneuraminate cytidylyltransferase/CMP-N,N'-diacetyllegionaminic acid synthase
MTGLKRICTVCARAGSKGVRNKNLRRLGGKPLLAHTVELAKAGAWFDEIAVSSDSEAILEAGLAAGATFAVRRPDELASDTADKSPAIVHAVAAAERQRKAGFDTMVDLDVTSPFRSAADIAGAIGLVENEGYRNAFSVTPSGRSPYYNMVLRTAGGSARVVIPLDPPPLRRQDAPPVFDMNASIYVWNRDTFFPDAPIFTDRTGLWEMPAERSVDIDTEFDWELAQWLYNTTPR